MKQFIQKIGRALVACILLLTVNACNNEDNVIGIFTGKTWKLSFIAAEGSYEQFDFWGGDDAARQASMTALSQTGTFVLSFEGSDLTESAGGSFNGRAIRGIIDGKWNANGKNNKLTLNDIKSTQSETDVLARAFVTGLQNAFKYEGDYNNLFIYYKEGQTVKRMGFKPQK